ncbi:MAG: polysaccharide biosynthesis protein [Pelosinus sp.]|nr:polysaccharide biosynthesis protein [Pelosinus sp.]
MRRRLISMALMLSDAVVVLIVPFLALYIRFEGSVDSRYFTMLMQYMPFILIIRLGVFYTFGLYNRLWRYAGINELLSIFGAVSISSVILIMYMYVDGATLPKSIYFLSWFFNTAFIGSSRLVVRIMHYLRQQHDGKCSKVLIIGAGDAGAMIAREIKHRYFDTKKIVGFIDDDQNKQHQKLLGVKVLGNREDIRRIASECSINEIIIAIPSAGGAVIREVVRECKETKCQVKILPGIYEIIDGNVSVQQLRNVDVEDLLGRDPVQLDLEEIAGYLRGKRVLVTGAGGSIGSEICRQISKVSPSALYLLGKGENSIYEINGELREKYAAEFDIWPIIADVRDKERIESIFSEVRPQVVFHAAAHKHVPLMEAQPVEAVRNNIFGTKNVAEAADRYSVERFVMISTDKAVNPTSVMGASKRIAELVVQNLSKSSKTKFVAVRFGNVLGSRGSVIPLFKKQIAKGGPITITHPEMIRYFMTIPEASQLVLQAGSMAQGGEVFVLDMGKPVKIVDMACDLIELSGLVPYKDIKIQFTGLRPGEKLFEELLTAEEGTASTKHNKIFRANLKQVNENRLSSGLSMLNGVETAEEIIKIMSGLIPTYKSARLQENTARKNQAVHIEGERYNERNRQYRQAVNDI